MDIQFVFFEFGKAYATIFKGKLDQAMAEL